MFPYDDEEELNLEQPVEPELPPGDPVQEAPAPMSPNIRDYIAKKFNLGDYGDEARKKLVEENSGYDLRGGIAGALMALGDGNGMNVINARNSERQRNLENFDKGRAGKIQEYDLDRKLKKDMEADDLMTREADPKSAESQMATELAQRMGYKGPPVTAKQFKSFSPALQKIYDIEQKKLDRQEARDERRFQSGIKLDEKKRELTTQYGEANTPDDAKKLKDAAIEKDKFDRSLNELIKMRKDAKGGQIMDREAVNRAKQLATDLKIAYKNMAQLGVLSKSDEMLLNKVIPEDPTEYNSPLAALRGQDPILNNMSKFKNDSEVDFQSSLKNRLRGGSPVAAGDAESAARQKRIAELKAKQKTRTAGR